jgi:hypothetical protein
MKQALIIIFFTIILCITLFMGCKELKQPTAVNPAANTKTISPTVTITPTVTQTPTITPTFSGTVVTTIFKYHELPDTGYVETYDTFISTSYSNRNRGNCIDMEVEYQFGNVISRSLIKFRIDGYIPAGATILAAVFQLWIDGSAYIQGDPWDMNLRLYEITQDWEEGTGTCPPVLDSYVSATWNYKNTAAWGAPGGDYGQPASGYRFITFSEMGGFSYNEIQLYPSIVQNWLDNPSQNHGFIIKREPESGGMCTIDIATKESTSNMKPRLVVIYNP